MSGVCVHITEHSTAEELWIVCTNLVWCGQWGSQKINFYCINSTSSASFVFNPNNS